MTYCYRENQRGITTKLAPNAKQKKFLAQIGATREYGSNYNGYGYKDKNKVYKLSIAEVRAYNRLTDSEPKKPLTFDEKKERWAKRLSKLTEISLDQAMQIADEKIEYKQNQISLVQDKQYDRYSTQRAKLIAKMERENPLRTIKDIDHARAILIASHRHNYTNYEVMLDEARELAMLGVIDRSEVRETARKKINGAVIKPNPLQ